MSQLSNEERELLDFFESGKLQRSAALVEGIPYQTLVATTA